MIRLSISACLLALVFVLASPGNYLRFSVAALLCIALLSAWACVLFISYGISNRPWRTMLEKVDRWAIAILIGLFLHNLWSFWLVDDLRSGIMMALPSVMKAAGCLLAATTMAGNRSGIPPLAGVAGGIALYSLTNVVAYSVFGMTGSTMGSIDRVTVESALGEADRMLAPFAEGMNNFGNDVVVGAGLGMLLMWNAVQRRSMVMAIVYGAVLAIGTAGALLVQMRSGLLVLVVAGVYLAVQKWRIGAAFVFAIGLLFAFGAVAYQWAFRAGVVSGVLEALPEALLRDREDPALLSGRVFIWNYAQEHFGSGQIPWLGLGARVRDMSPAVVAVGLGVGEAGMTCHNGALDLLICYGTPIGASIIAYCVFIAWMEGRRMRRNESGVIDIEGGLAAGTLVVALIAALFESFTGGGLFWALLAIRRMAVLPVVQGSIGASVESWRGAPVAAATPS